MKTLLILAIGLFSLTVNAEECVEQKNVVSQDVIHNVNKNMPNHLKGAVIIVRLADGTETKVPAERFMVVPRVQKTIVGQNKSTFTKLTCNKDQKKNILYVGAKRELTDLEVKGNNVNKSAQVDSLKVLTPNINYMRRKILGSDLNLGGGVDKNGQLQGTIGLDF